MKAIFPAYLLIATLYIILMEQLPIPLAATIKPLPILLLIIPVYLKQQGIWRTAMIFALLFSAGGDVFLALEPSINNMFIAGLGSFLVAQLIYAGLFWSDRSPDSGRRILIFVSLIILLVAATAIIPKTGELMLPVIVYILAIGSMLTGAAVCNRPPNRLFTGAMLFAISDCLIAINKFIMPIPAAGILIMMSYYSAQYLIVTGSTVGWVEQSDTQQSV